MHAVRAQREAAAARIMAGRFRPGRIGVRARAKEGVERVLSFLGCCELQR